MEFVSNPIVTHLFVAAVPILAWYFFSKIGTESPGISETPATSGDGNLSTNRMAVTPCVESKHQDIEMYIEDKNITLSTSDNGKQININVTDSALELDKSVNVPLPLVDISEALQEIEEKDREKVTSIGIAGVQMTDWSQLKVFPNLKEMHFHVKYGYNDNYSLDGLENIPTLESLSFGPEVSVPYVPVLPNITEFSGIWVTKPDLINIATNLKNVQKLTLDGYNHKTNGDIDLGPLKDLRLTSLRLKNFKSVDISQLKEMDSLKEITPDPGVRTTGDWNFMHLIKTS